MVRSYRRRCGCRLSNQPTSDRYRGGAIGSHGAGVRDGVPKTAEAPLASECVRKGDVHGIGALRPARQTRPFQQPN